MSKYLKYLLILLIIIPLSTSVVQAKKKKAQYQNPRLTNLSGEDLDMFNDLTKKQQKDIREGKIKTGYNAWMIELALGKPFYRSEHHPVYVDYEEVWLYTKDDIDRQHKEEKIIDPQTNWPTIHKYTRIKTCLVGDFFVLYDRGVVEKIIADKSEKIYGSCTITTQEEFLPIVDKKSRR